MCLVKDDLKVETKTLTKTLKHRDILSVLILFTGGGHSVRTALLEGTPLERLNSARLMEETWLLLDYCDMGSLMVSQLLVIGFRLGIGLISGLCSSIAL